ncbi:MAG TPA: hypothetical protein VEZ14_12295 [Dehalococcoidia bacterium]|nr:hypothetical protein [Dehalococcoidia bacterium]
MKWLLASALLAGGALAAVPAVGAFQNLGLAHPDSSPWVYWSVGVSFAVLSAAFVSAAVLVLLMSKRRA